jgi:hypothetical protein
VWSCTCLIALTGTKTWNRDVIWNKTIKTPLLPASKSNSLQGNTHLILKDFETERHWGTLQSKREKWAISFKHCFQGWECAPYLPELLERWTLITLTHFWPSLWSDLFLQIIYINNPDSTRDSNWEVDCPGVDLREGFGVEILTQTGQSGLT